MEILLEEVDMIRPASEPPEVHAHRIFDGAEMKNLTQRRQPDTRLTAANKRHAEQRLHAQNNRRQRSQMRRFLRSQQRSPETHIFQSWDNRDEIQRRGQRRDIQHVRHSARSQRLRLHLGACLQR